MKKRVIFHFAHPVTPPQVRQKSEHARSPADLDTTCPSYIFFRAIYFQTTDRDGFGFGYGQSRWLDETRCELTVAEDQPLAVQAMCHTTGFGQVMGRADNAGALYHPRDWRDDEVILFDVEAAKSEWADCLRRVESYRQQGLGIESGMLNRLDSIGEQLKSLERLSSPSTKLEAANSLLGIALAVSEDLELARARWKLARLPKRPFSFSAFVDWNGQVFARHKENALFTERYLSVFNAGAVTAFWKLSQPDSPDQFDFRQTDAQFEWLERQGITPLGHCLGWLQWVPHWVKEIRNMAELTERMLVLAETTVRRYGHVDFWSIINESHDWIRDISLPVEDRVRLVNAVSERVRSIHPGAVIESDSCLVTAPWRMVQPDMPVGPREWYDKLDRCNGLDYIIGLQIYHGGGAYATYDMGRLARQLEYYCSRGRPVHVYAETPGGDNPDAVYANNGSWHGPWSEENQADWWERFLTIALSFPQIIGITTVTLADGQSVGDPAIRSNWMREGAFCRSDLSPKPVVRRVQDLLGRHTTGMERQMQGANRS
jgi:hypothetical protein